MSDQKKPTETSSVDSHPDELDADQLESVAGGAGGAGGTLPSESISLNYGKVKWSYTPQVSEGGDGTSPNPVAPRKSGGNTSLPPE